MKNDQGQQYVYLFVAILALGFTGWFYSQPALVTNPIPKETLDHMADMIITSLNVTQFNEKGMPANHFYTPQLTHYPYNNSSEFTNPHIILYPDDAAPWVIQSDKGTAEQGAEKVVLSDNVIMHQDAYGNEKVKNITTSQITYFTEKDWAETDKNILFVQPGLRVRSKGMTANLKTQKINLLKNVTSEYIPDATAK